jgi:paraquat-inducible protein B
MEKTNEQVAEELLNTLREIQDTEEYDNLVRSNFIEFTIKDENYKVRVPNLRERAEIREQRVVKFNELVNKGIYKPKEILIKELETQGTFIRKLEEKSVQLQSQIEDLYLRLIPIQEENIRAKLRQEVIDLINTKTVLLLDIDKYLENSIENVLSTYLNYYYSYLILEKKVEDKWVKAFENFDAFYNSFNTELINKTAYYSGIIISKYEGTL